MPLLLIDSKNRIDASSTTSNFTIDLSKLDNKFYRNRVELYFVRCVIPYSFYNIRNGVNDEFTITYGNATTKTIFLTGTTRVEGNYGINDMLALAKTQMDINSAGQTFTLTLSPITGRITVTASTGTFSLTFANTESNKILGFEKGTYASTLTSLVAPYVANRFYERNIQIKTTFNYDVSDYETGKNSGSTKLLSTVPVSGQTIQPFGNIYYEELQPNKKIINSMPNNLTVELTYTDGSRVDLNGLDWSCQIAFD